MRLAMDGNGRVDPARLQAARAMAFADAHELHVAQDALDELMEADRKRRRRVTPRNGAT